MNLPLNDTRTFANVDLPPCPTCNKPTTGLAYNVYPIGVRDHVFADGVQVVFGPCRHQLLDEAALTWRAGLPPAPWHVGLPPARRYIPVPTREDGPRTELDRSIENLEQFLVGVPILIVVSMAIAGAITLVLGLIK